MDSEQLLAALRDDIEWPAATLRLLPPLLHNLGRAVASSALAAAVSYHQIIALLDRHAQGDWGELGQAANKEGA